MDEDNEKRKWSKSYYWGVNVGVLAIKGDIYQWWEPLFKSKYS